jgi:hypothetical protein
MLNENIQKTSYYHHWMMMVVMILTGVNACEEEIVAPQGVDVCPCPNSTGLCQCPGAS